MIDLNNITIRICGKTLLENANAHVPDNKKVGLIGHNGCGKSTLFRAILNEQSIESGLISYPTNSRIAYMRQEMDAVNVSPLDYLLAADKERTELLNRLQNAPETQLAEIYEQLNAIEADTAEARACQILKGLGFKDDDFHRPLSEFSGGWRMRVALAATLFQPSDILLLDEPTNHLDLESSIWLLNFLQKYRGTLLLISHDKNFLNDLCNTIIHFESRKLNTYTGNYNDFQRLRATQMELQNKLIEKQEAKRAHLQSFVDRFRYKATKARQAQSRLKMLEKMTLNVTAYENISSHFEFPAPTELASPIFKIENGSVGYEENKPVLTKLNLQIDKDDRIAMLGANGNGKSTLAKLIDGKLPLMTGQTEQSKKLNIGYFAQHQMEELPFGLTPTAYMTSLMPDANETKVRAHLASFGLEGQKAITRIEQLSGGEKARLLFAVITHTKPNLLILDEPTNHLDIDAREALVDALNSYTGAVVLITHDLNLIEMVADRLWLVANGTCVPYTDDIESYQKMLLDAQKTIAQTKKEERSVLTPKEKRQQQAIKLQSMQPIKKQIKSLEDKMQKTNERISSIEQMFMQNLNPGQMVDLQKELGLLNKELQNDENLWLELNEKLESFQ
ncbi:MAG: ABC-F family ATP-binding cassette domain-containing protein [Alphaproteobacteria bacterium]|nr:ABC-F family ATP-binding cassette domain-containing protein [Alphaproteobacteria bacterium]